MCSISVAAQKRHPKPIAKPKQIILAVIYDGSVVEPIAVVENGKLATFREEGSFDDKPFSDMYYKPYSKYNLIFGGSTNGTVTIKSTNVGKGDCGGVSADVAVASTKAKLEGFVMTLATNLKPKSATTYCRKPTPAERSMIEDLVHAKYTNYKVPSATLKNLHYYNLTAVDIDNDGKAEFIGSYWVAPKADERDLLFFVAEIEKSGKYSLTHSEYSPVKPDDLMSGDVKDIDEMGGELLLDVLDYDNDGVSEIFTIIKAFEGNNYNVYKRVGGKWKKVFHTYDYRCGY